MKITFENTYAQLPDRFYELISPTPVKNPKLIKWNDELANHLNIRRDPLEDSQLVNYFSGNQIIPTSQPLAQAYSGHQFGYFSDQLGDGRAHLLGEIRDSNNKLWDVQLKGSGPTRFSRRGDGRAALGPMMREYLLGEAMHALGIPTTRALALVSTGEYLQREELLPGALLTRVASSHIRVGTFEYFYARRDFEGLKLLADFVINRHFPFLRSNVNPYLDLLDQIISKQAKLVAQWMSVGFVHGVMNTDNMAISGETIDYGPCAFLDEYDPMKVFSSIDKNGRYAFAQQPAIAIWNLSSLGNCFRSLVADQDELALQLVKGSVEKFSQIFQDEILNLMSSKLGFSFQFPERDRLLVQGFLDLMHQQKADYTLCFATLVSVLKENQDHPLIALLGERSETDLWIKSWKERISEENLDKIKILQKLKETNPQIIPRNHQIEKTIQAAYREGNFEPFEKLLSALKKPFDETEGFEEYKVPPLPTERITATFCGT